MSSDYPLKVFYDASCPVRARDVQGKLVSVDMSAPRFDAARRRSGS